MTQPSFSLTDKQREAIRLLGGAARHVLLYGGSRSGKTFLLVRAIITRALAVAGSRHCILRFRFNHLSGSIIHDTLPKVMDLCFPGVAEHCQLDKVNWFYKFPNGSEIWFGGLDDKQRTEKILGQEYATLYFNECSQIPYSSRNMAVTRLAQNCPPLRLKAYYDCNPPNDGHWTYKLFVQGVDPDKRSALRDPALFASMRLNPVDNQPNLPREYLDELANMPARWRERFYEGKFASATTGALWTLELLDRTRHEGTLPELRRIVIGVDPSGSGDKDEDKRSDEVGIVVAGVGADGKGYVLEDLSGHMGPTEWGRVVGAAFDRWAADSVIAEINYGGAMVEHVIRAARPRTPIRTVTATRGKVVRAEPIAVLFEQGQASLAGSFPVLEDQLCAYTTYGYTGDRSPDRADAMIWALSDLFPTVHRGIARTNRPAFIEPYPILG